jgi:hypothetical protein
MLTVLVAVTGYLLVYLGTPHQLDWHLRFSLDRLLMQLWPAVLFAAFLLLNTAEEAARALIPLEATGDLTPLRKRN